MRSGARQVIAAGKSGVVASSWLTNGSNGVNAVGTAGRSYFGGRFDANARATVARPIPKSRATEVVWCWRRSPAHAVVASVPLPESGHRFRDVLLHDGEPKGTRRSGDAELSVFDEIARLADSGLPKWQAQVSGASEADITAAGDVFGERGLGVDNWSGINVMCSDCSHGSPGDDHRHETPPDGTVVLGLAGQEDEVAQGLQTWRAARAGVDVLAVDLLW